MILDAVPAAWQPLLQSLRHDPALLALSDFLEAEATAGKAIYPPREHWFAALEHTRPDAVRVVILGQDPYHGPGQAHGLSFSVPPGVRMPPSLNNIWKELARDFGLTPPQHGTLTRWAEQGVLLLNTVLTVEANKAASHAKRGWEILTDTLIRELAARETGVVFLLWGSHAQKKSRADRPPAPLRAGIGTPLAAVRLSRLYRLRPLQRRQPVLATTRPRAHRLGDLMPPNVCPKKA